MGHHDCKCSMKSDNCRKHSHSKCQKKCCKPATIKTKCILGDLTNENESGGYSTGDPNMAVGPEQIVTTVNTVVVINDKHTGQRLSLTSAEDFWNIVQPSADTFNIDPVVLFDEFTNRFIVTLWELVNFNNNAELIIESPGLIAGTYPASKGSNAGSQAPFDLSGLDIAPADPLNADTPLVNDLTGKIALISSDGFATSSSNKCNNATNAGAIACIIFNSDTNTLINIFGSSIVPSISVGKEIGEAMLANLPVVGGMKSLSNQEIGANGFSRMHIAVSKDATPKTKDDFFTFVLGDENEPYKRLVADYPKLGIDEDAIYISTMSFGSVLTPEETVTYFQQIVAVEKAPLIAGTGPVNILLNNKLLKDPVFPFFIAGGNSICEFRCPTMLRTPKTNTKQVTFFVNAKVDNPIGVLPADGDTLVVTAIKEILSGSPEVTTFEIPVKPWTSPVMYLPTDIRNTNVPQPDGILQGFGLPSFSLNIVIGVGIMYRCVQFKDSLWCCHSVGGEVANPNLWEVRWYEIDVSKIFDNNNPTVSLKQQGSIIPGGTTSAFYPNIDVDKDGNMGIGFNISGPDQPVAMAHTGRLKNDPKGTVRFPLEVNFEAQKDLPYINNSVQSASNWAVRWNDYTSLVLDSSDGKTFWFCSQYSNLNENDYLNQITSWTVGTQNFCVDKKKCAKTVCRQKGCPKIKSKVVTVESQDVQVFSKEDFVEELKKKAPKNKKWWKNPAV